MTTDLEVYRDIPGYKAILRSVLNSQIQLLVHQLSEHTGDETVVITANVTERCHGNMGSSPGNKFLQQNTSVKEQFLNFCLGHHDGTSRFTQQPSSISPRKSSAQNLFKLKPDIWKSTLRNGPYTQKTTRRTLKSPAKPSGSKGHMFENLTDINHSVNENIVKVVVDASPNESPRSHSRFDPMISGQGHKVKDRGHTYDMDIEEALRHANGSPMMDAEGEGAEIANTDIYLMTGTHNQTQEDNGNHPAVTVKTKTSIVTRSSKRKSAMPSRRYQDPYAQGVTTLSYSQSRDTTQSLGDTRVTPLFPSNSSVVTPSDGNTSGATLAPSHTRVQTLSSSHARGKTLSSNNTPSVFMSPGSNPQNSSLAIHMVKMEPEVEPEVEPDLTITDVRDVTVSPGLNLHKSSPASTIVPKVEPQDITDTSTDDESVAASSHHSSSPAPPLVVIETKEELSLLPGYGGVVFPEPSAAPLSDPSRSTRQQASVTTPQLSPNPDVMLVSRGEGRYEKLIHCEICGKVCRTSNMARHRKRYCLLSPKREELPGKNSPSVIKSEKNSPRSSKGEAYGRSLYGDES